VLICVGTSMSSDLALLPQAVGKPPRLPRPLVHTMRISLRPPVTHEPIPLRDTPFRLVPGSLTSCIVHSLTPQHVLLFRRPKDYDLHHKPFAVSNASSRMVNVAPQK
jgi:hypothetical protein